MTTMAAVAARTRRLKFGPSVLIAPFRSPVLAARQGFLDDTLKLYKGPLKDNKGNQVIAAGQEVSNTDNAFKLNVKWLVEGAIGSTGLQ